MLTYISLEDVSFYASHQRGDTCLEVNVQPGAHSRAVRRARRNFLLGYVKLLRGVLLVLPNETFQQFMKTRNMSRVIL